MKKILPLIFVAVLMIFAVAQSSEAFTTAAYPNGDYMWFYAPDEWEYGLTTDDSLIVTAAADGNYYATALDYLGLPSTYWYQMYLTWDGYLYCSEDGSYWFICP